MNTAPQKKRARSTGKLSIGALSRATGIPIDTLRTWERRYSFPNPERKPSGHRVYNPDHIHRLKLISRALERGLRAGEALGYSEEELETFLDEAPPQPPTLAAGARLDDPQETIDQLLECIRSYDSFRFTALLDSLWSQKGPIECMAHYIAPLVQQVGDLWHEGKLHIRNEHFMTERISDYLRAARLPLEARAQGPRVILATLPGEIHGLGLQMAALTLAVAGARPVLLGTDIPLEEMYEAAMQQNARAVMISVSLHASNEQTISLLRELRDLLPHYVGLFTGGQGAPAVRGIEHFSTLFELDYFTRSRLLAL